jgi:large subunit ribosomal protein L4
MQVTVKTLDNTAAGSVDLADAVFNLETVKPEVVARVVQWQLDKRRAGTHKTKGISDVSGTTKKPFKQKGGGRARQGSLRSPQFRGGGIIFGPVVREHGYRLNKKERRLGLCMALTDKTKAGNLIVVDEIPSTLTKTRELAAKLKAMDAGNALFVLSGEAQTQFLRLARNIPNINVLPPQGANVYDVVRHAKVIVSKAAVAELEERLS